MSEIVDSVKRGMAGLLSIRGRSKAGRQEITQQQLTDVVGWGSAALICLSVAYGIHALQEGPAAEKLTAAYSQAADANRNRAAVDNVTTGTVANSANRRKPQKEVRRTTVVGRSLPDAIPQRQDGRAGKPANNDAEDLKNGAYPIGISLGTGQSFSLLGKRYTALANAAPALFSALSARATIVDNADGIEAHLLAGPVADYQSAIRLCDKIRQRVNTTCTPARFTGRALKIKP